MTTPAAWTDDDILNIIKASERIARHRASGPRAAVDCWTDSLREFESAVKAGAASRLPAIRLVVGALARSYAETADHGGLWDVDHLDSVVSAVYSYGLARNEKGTP